MSTRHGKPEFCRQSANYSWYRRQGSNSFLPFHKSECSQPPLQGGRRAPPMVPGRIPLREEAELFLGVTKASAEPETGAIPLGLLNFKPDGFSHPLSDSDNIPLRYTINNDNLIESDYVNSAPFRGQIDQLSGSGDISMGSASGFIGDGTATKERTSHHNSTKTDSFYNSTFVDNNMSRSINSLDKSYKQLQTFTV